MQTPGSRLRHIREKNRFSRSYFAKKYHLPEVTLKKWESDANILTKKGLKRCAAIFLQEGIILDQDWIMTGKESINQIKDAGTPYLTDENTGILHEADFFKKTYPDAAMLMVNDDTMEPTYKKGDYVGGRFRYGKIIETALREICIIKLPNDENILRRLFPGNKKDTYNLTCINPETSIQEPILFNVKIAAAAPAIWHRKPNP